MSLTNYNIASWLVSKTLSLSYFIAFVSLMTQVLGLYGRQGLLSIDHLLNLLDKEMKAERFYHMPSFFWFFSSDNVLKGVCFVGMMASSLAFLGFSQTPMLLVCFLCYLSFVSCGQIFLSYQWDSLLLEFGFLGLFFAPFQFEWLPFGTHTLHPLIYFMSSLLLFKLMFLSGAVKLTSKDPTWRDLTALRFHYWTQPLPTFVSFFVHKLPLQVHRATAGVLFLVELVMPFLIFVPGPQQIVAVAFLAALQILIALTGNYSFFNFLTLGLTLAVLPDSAWGFKINWVETQSIPLAVAFIPVIVVAPASIFWLIKGINDKTKILDFMFPYMRFLYQFRLSNPYGLFAVMTKSRPELSLEGSDDGVTWKEYTYRYKPTSEKSFPGFVAPHQPRLDWQLWFAALESFNENLWLQNLCTRIFEGSPDVLQLFAQNPFPKEPPKALRILRYEYQFASFSDWRQSGAWWKRELIGPYSPVFQREEFND